MPDLEAFAENIWITDGPPTRFMGVTLPTRMIVARLTDGSLWVNSPVSVPTETLSHIMALGPVKHLVAPTKLHVWRLEEWHSLFPNAELWMPPQIPRKFRHLLFTAILGDAPPRCWADDFDQLVFNGNFFIEEVFFFHKKSHTVVLADFIQNHRTENGRPFLNLLLKLGGVAYPCGGVPRDVRLTFTNRKLARQSLKKLVAWDFDKLIIGHGVCVNKDAKQFVERAFRWL
jgi:hypothetical protein